MRRDSPYLSRSLKYFNSHTPHGVRLQLVFKLCDTFLISTHTPHTGCDFIAACYSSPTRNFNSHTPHGVRRCNNTLYTALSDFNSHTPHGVRHMQHLYWTYERNFNSHTPHGVRRKFTRRMGCGTNISTHTPHTGCDRKVSALKSLPKKFQLTHPTRGATLHIVKNRVATTKWSGPKQSSVYFSA